MGGQLDWVWGGVYSRVDGLKIIKSGVTRQTAALFRLVLFDSRGNNSPGGQVNVVSVYTGGGRLVGGGGGVGPKRSWPKLRLCGIILSLTVLC